jgi:hypothetical protein
MTADFLNLYSLKGFALATAASPAPRVFSAVRGLETYSTNFYLQWTDHQGAFHSVEITSEMYSHLRGPYNRRNVFGAVLAYGPVLADQKPTRPMFDAVASYALCGNAPILRELGIDPATVAGPLMIQLEPRHGTYFLASSLTIEAPCR